MAITAPAEGGIAGSAERDDGIRQFCAVGRHKGVAVLSVFPMLWGPFWAPDEKILLSNNLHVE
jgi:hypothetical protein